MSVVNLRGDVVRIEQAPDAVPAEPGLYAWWSLPGALPGITGPRHPDGGHELVYVGIARNGPSSRATLRSRVVGNHIRGTTGQSTLRRASPRFWSSRSAGAVVSPTARCWCPTTSCG